MSHTLKPNLSFLSELLSICRFKPLIISAPSVHKPSHPIPGQFQPTFLLFSSHLHFPLLLPPLSGERERWESDRRNFINVLGQLSYLQPPPLPTFGSFKRQKEKVGTKSVVAGMKFVQKYQRSLSNICRILSFAGLIEL